MGDILATHKSWHNTQGDEGAKAYISEAGLIAAFLRGATLIEADLSGIYPIGADLMSILKITEEQIESAMITDATEIPDYLTAPATRKKRAKKEAKE
jgi:hypothetical protein